MVHLGVETGSCNGKFIWERKLSDKATPECDEEEGGRSRAPMVDGEKLGHFLYRWHPRRRIATALKMESNMRLIIKKKQGKTKIVGINRSYITTCVRTSRYNIAGKGEEKVRIKKTEGKVFYRSDTRSKVSVRRTTWKGKSVPGEGMGNQISLPTGKHFATKRSEKKEFDEKEAARSIWVSRPGRTGRQGSLSKVPGCKTGAIG